MKKIFVIGENLYAALSTAYLHKAGETNSSLSIPVNFMEGPDILEGKLTMCGKNYFPSNTTNTSFSFYGTFSVGNKEPASFTGIYTLNENYEECYLLVNEPTTHDVNITKQEFIDLTKKYCESRGIPTYENGNVMKGGFHIFENLPTESNAPSGTLGDRNNKNLEIKTMLHDDYFPVMEGKKIRFGKFITDTKIKLYTHEEVHLLGTHVLFS
jgi:hypothetical protein